MIFHFCKKNIYWANPLFRGQTLISNDRRWQWWMDQYLVHFLESINQTSMTEALKCSTQIESNHRRIIKDLLFSWCIYMNSFMTLYREAVIALHGYIDSMGLLDEGLFYGKHNLTNAALASSYPSSIISLFCRYCYLMQGGKRKIPFKDWLDAFISRHEE